MTAPILTILRAGGAFSDQQWQLRFWRAAFLVSVVVAYLHWFFPRQYDPEWVVVLGSDGSVTRSPVLRFGSAIRLHESHARLATSALLNRSPNGFDDLELLSTLFLPDAFQAAQMQLESEKAQRQAKKLHQKPQIASIETLETLHDRVLVRITGQVIRVGTFHDAPFQESVPFSLSLTLHRNPDMSRNQRFALAVASFTYDPRY